MNKHIQIRHFKGTAHARLIKKAKSKDLSLSQYLRLELEKLAEQPSIDEIFDGLRDVPQSVISSEDIVRFIHEGREERTDQILAAIGREKPTQK